MMLGDLAADAGAPLDPGSDVAITGFAIDNRKVAGGNVFGAFQGLSVNGEDFIPAAIAAGAVAVVARPEAAVDGALHLAHDRPRRLFARLAAPFFAPFPETVVAVTGTNGKTSVVEMVRQIWSMLGHQAASVGTLGITAHDQTVVTGLTTPDIVTFLEAMSGLAREGISHAAYEASSHGLSQYRIEGLPVAAGAFTNLSRDHLDYHGDMDAYFAAKMRLFDEIVGDDGVAVIWMDDSWSQQAADHVRRRGIRPFTVGENGETLRLAARVPGQFGQSLMLEYEGGLQEVQLPLIGGYQAANAMVAASLVLATGGHPPSVFDALSRVQPVRGRLEHAATSGSGAAIYVDYAHTPDALLAALAALRPHAQGRLLVVFGAGGDRDQGKRAQMGRIAAGHADVAFVTDDNPRGEDAKAIRAMVLTGCPDAIEIDDRRAAIGAALNEATEGDIVLIAGKGHEQGQIVGSGEDRQIFPFDDVAVARELTGTEGRKIA